MITMAIIALVGTGIIVLMTLFIQHQAAVFRRAVGAALDEEVREKLKRAKTLDTVLAQQVSAGADIDSAIEDFTKDRSSIHTLPTEKHWLWESADLLKWAKAQLAARAVAINHKARLVILSVLVGVALLVVAVDAVIYSNMSGPSPLLSPYPPTKSMAVPAPLPVPGSAPGAVDPSLSPSSP